MENKRFHSVVIRLVGELDYELTSLGLREDQIIKNGILDTLNKSVSFEHYHVITNHCVVWPDNYQILTQE